MSTPYVDGWSRAAMYEDFTTLGEYDGVTGEWSRNGLELSDLPTEEETIYAAYLQEDYSGSAMVLFVRDGKLWEVEGSHCSCYGLEDQWSPEEAELAAILNYKAYDLPISEYDSDGRWVPSEDGRDDAVNGVRNLIIERSRLLLGDKVVDKAIAVADDLRSAHPGVAVMIERADETFVAKARTWLNQTPLEHENEAFSMDRAVGEVAHLMQRYGCGPATAWHAYQFMRDHSAENFIRAAKYARKQETA